MLHRNNRRSNRCRSGDRALWLHPHLRWRMAAAEEHASFKLLVRQSDELRRLMVEMLERIELLK